ncbi:MAG: hypothetical protein KDC99_07225 [Cyclobacteriaceae bacterium]|nr:hypothetical protein [Cyclobacteriaceae bacterium]
MFRNLSFIVLSVCLLSCSSDDDEQRVLAGGNYKGLWTSNTATASFSNLAISAKLTEVTPGKFEGTFFISNNFTSCCGGVNDGAISFTVSEDAITNFVWDDTIIGCTGSFEGNGKILSNNSLKMEITGTDCDGDHTGYFTLSM